MKQKCVGSVLLNEGQLRGAHNACTWTQKTHARCDVMLWNKSVWDLFCWMKGSSVELTMPALGHKRHMQDEMWFYETNVCGICFADWRAAPWSSQCLHLDSKDTCKMWFYETKVCEICFANWRWSSQCQHVHKRGKCECTKGTSVREWRAGMWLTNSLNTSFTVKLN